MGITHSKTSIKSDGADPTKVRASDWNGPHIMDVAAPTGLTGATSAARFVGGTTSGAPATGTFEVGDYVVEQTGKIYICVTAGSPGTWKAVSGGTPESPDLPPDSPHAMDDEFLGGVLDPKWTIWNQTAGQFVRVGNSHLNLWTPYSINGRRVLAVIQPITDTPPWTVRFHSMLNAATWNYFGMGPIIRRVTGHDYGLFPLLGYFSGQQGTIFTMRLDGTSMREEAADSYNFQWPCYWQVEFDGANITVGVSGVGDFYTRVILWSADSDLGGPPEYVGINVHPWSDATSDYRWGGSASFDWFRVTVPDYKVAHPLMTSGTTPSGIVTSSTEYSLTAPWRVFGSVGGWVTAAQNTGWIQYQFPVAETIVSYAIRPWWFDTVPYRNPKTWTFNGSNDGSSWTVLDSHSGYSFDNANDLVRFPISSPGSYAYYRLNVTENNGDTYLGIGYLKLHKAR